MEYTAPPQLEEGSDEQEVSSQEHDMPGPSSMEKEPPILSGIKTLENQGVAFSEKTRAFLTMLVNKLPGDADPEIQTDTGSNVDVIWGDKLMIMIGDEEEEEEEPFIVVGCFKTKGSAGEFYEFESGRMEEACQYILESYTKLVLRSG